MLCGSKQKQTVIDDDNKLKIDGTRTYPRPRPLPRPLPRPRPRPPERRLFCGDPADGDGVARGDGYVVRVDEGIEVSL